MDLDQVTRDTLEMVKKAQSEGILVSTGIYGYPIALACRIALRTTKAFLEHHTQPRLVTFVCFTAHDLDEYKLALAEIVNGVARLHPVV